MSNELSIMEKVVIEGDLSVLNNEDRIRYYAAVCESVGLNPLTKPFEYIKLNNKLTLYAKRDATDQLRKVNGISVQIVSRELIGDVYVVTARATDKTGRSDESIGAVPIKGLTGESLANAYMKAETKAKRRVTLSVAGLGMLDETEVITIPGAEPAPSPKLSGKEGLKSALKSEDPMESRRRIAGNLEEAVSKYPADERKSLIQHFLSSFGIKKISDLRDEDIEAAEKMIAEMDGLSPVEES